MNTPLTRAPRRLLVAALALALAATTSPVGTSAQASTPGPTETPAADPVQLPPTEAEDPTGDLTLSPEEKTPPGPSDETEGITFHRGIAGGGPRNILKVKNRVDGRLRVRSDIELNQIDSRRVGPVNMAYAEASCVGCQTFAVALQIDLVGRDAEIVVPRNIARALNVECTRCITIARAIQYVIQVDDPAAVPPRVEALVSELDRELHDIHRDSHALTAAQAWARITAATTRFNDLATGLDDRTDELASPDAASDPTPTPTVPEPAPTPTTTSTPPTP